MYGKTFVSARLLGLFSLYYTKHFRNQVIHQKCLIKWTGKDYEIPGFLGSNTGDNYDILDKMGEN